jgi:hypothetical protein
VPAGETTNTKSPLIASKRTTRPEGNARLRQRHGHRRLATRAQRARRAVGALVGRGRDLDIVVDRARRTVTTAVASGAVPCSRAVIVTSVLAPTSFGMTVNVLRGFSGIGNTAGLLDVTM